MPSPLRVALYARVSTSEQSLDPQLDALRKYAEARSWQACEFLDYGQSGGSDQREGLKALLDSRWKNSRGDRAGQKFALVTQ